MAQKAHTNNSKGGHLLFIGFVSEGDEFNPLLQPRPREMSPMDRESLRRFEEEEDRLIRRLDGKLPREEEELLEELEYDLPVVS